MPEPTIERAIETSVGFAFNNKDTDPKTIAARNQLEQRTRSGKEWLLGLGKTAAIALAREGFMPDITNDVGKRYAVTLWKTAEDRVRQRLKNEIEKGNTKWVLATLGEIDPCDVPIQNISAKPGERQEIGVRRSVGLPRGSKAHFHEANPKAKFPNNQTDSDQIVLGQESFSKEVVKRVLAGKGKYQPMWRQNDVLLPLIDSQTGELHFFTITTDQLPELALRLKNIQIEFGGRSDVGIARNGKPDEDSYFCGGKGKGIDIRLANASSNIAAYNEAAKNNQNTPEQDQKLLASQDQLRLANESADIIFANGVESLFIVADGMGGVDLGELASQSAIRLTLNKLAETTGWSNLSPDQVQQKIKEAVEAANENVFASKQGMGKELGSTLTMAMVVGGKLYTANVGDSRVYLYDESNDSLIRLTRDHSLVESLVGAGQITDGERYAHPNRNMVYRNLGGKATVEVDVTGPREIEGKVKILTCCDGLWEMVRDPLLKTFLSQQKPSGELARQLIAAANAAGGDDNITAIVAELNVS
ncbi:serine/threonine-protein phosphatase [Candidatus Collierbacteria bacterium]|nr:serine/threonine-protein phosphatase [Candidatus Collierbacteria bacterium]